MVFYGTYKLFIFYIAFFINPFYIAFICWSVFEFTIISKCYFFCFYSYIRGNAYSILLEEKSESIKYYIFEAKNKVYKLVTLARIKFFS
ncbi:hypothetical protein ATO50_08340 [Aeromonas hydrophila]|nr:hypothetical protein ATO50_08340 [Aeromonas hydrophila]